MTRAERFLQGTALSETLLLSKRANKNTLPVAPGSLSGPAGTSLVLYLLHLAENKTYPTRRNGRPGHIGRHLVELSFNSKVQIVFTSDAGINGICKSFGCSIGIYSERSGPTPGEDILSKYTMSFPRGGVAREAVGLKPQHN